MGHICDKEFTVREKYLTCKNCGKPLLDNQLVKDSYQISNQLTYLNAQIKIIADILKDKGDLINSVRLEKLISKADKILKY